MSPVDPSDPQGLLDFIDASPSPFHVVAEAAARFQEAGFVEQSFTGSWASAGRLHHEGAPVLGFARRAGALLAWMVPAGAPAAAPVRIVGAHTDSPNLRLKPQPDTGRAGWRQLGVEVYGGALLNSWLDRDLGLSGRVALRAERAGGPVELRLLKVDRPVLRIPQLAIHLDRNVNEHGIVLNRQTQLVPVWGLGGPEPGRFQCFVAEELDVDPGRVMATDVMAHDLTPGARLGIDGELLSAARIDNLASCHAAVTGLAELASADERPNEGPVAVVCLYDHEEVGSTSATGADGALLASTLERLVLVRGGGREDLLRALSASVCLSADGAHATHPNYLERHEPEHPVMLNAGPVLKVNANQRYATDAETAALFERACDVAGVPMQRFVSRSDVVCGSTIGPLTAARLGIRTVDAGLAQLSMHSARELCGAEDPALLARAIQAFLAAR